MEVKERNHDQASEADGARKNGRKDADPPADAVESPIQLTLSLEEARILRAVGQRGMLAAGDSAPGGQPQHASSALAKLTAAIDDGETVVLVREELGNAGIDTRRLSDAQIASLGRRLADIPKRSR